MNTKMNQRRLATIEKIESAFTSLLQLKRVREISVKMGMYLEQELSQ